MVGLKDVEGMFSRNMKEEAMFLSSKLQYCLGYRLVGREDWSRPIIERVLSGTFTKFVTMSVSLEFSQGGAVAASINTFSASLLVSMSTRLLICVSWVGEGLITRRRRDSKLESS